MYQDYIEILAEEARRCLIEMSGEPVLGFSVKEETPKETERAVAVSLAYTAAKNAMAGRLLLELPGAKATIGIADAMAKKMDAGPVRELNATAIDLLKEFLNTILGRTLTIWENTGHPLVFDAPVFVENGDDCALESPLLTKKQFLIQLNLTFSRVALYATFSENPAPVMMGRKALVVDDSGVARAYIARILQKAGLEVREASDGRDAVDKHRDFKPDITLMDLLMPRMTGLEAIQAIREFDPDARFVILTSSAMRGQVLAAKKLGVGSYLLKPPDENKILALLNRLLKTPRSKPRGILLM